MHWHRWYRFTSYVRSSLWVVPFIAIVLENIAIRVIERLDGFFIGLTMLGWGVEGAQAAYGTIVSATLTLIVFTFGSLLVAIPVARGQMTPRIIATALLRDKVVKYSVGLFVFTLLFAAGALNRTENQVHQLTLLVAWVLGLLCIATFLYLIDYAARLLRPVSIVARVSDHGIAVIEDVYPEPAHPGPSLPPLPSILLGPPARIVNHRGKSQIVVAVNSSILVAEAQRLDGVIEFLPQVGDFVSVGEPIFWLYGGAVAADDRRLRHAVVLGPERTLEQDPLFAFRILVDIANKALSPAINDPTTAVLTIDQLHRLLRLVGRRHLRNDRVTDAAGRLRLILPTPNWEDFVHVVYCEIREYGAGNLQIARRLRAMSENLLHTLPEHRHLALREEMGLLDQMITKLYTSVREQALARVADSQGLGGASRRRGVTLSVVRGDAVHD